MRRDEKKKEKKRQREKKYNSADILIFTLLSIRNRYSYALHTFHSGNVYDIEDDFIYICECMYMYIHFYTKRYSLLGRDYPIPAKFLKIDGEFVSTTSGLLAGFVAIKSYVSLDPRPSSRVEFLRLYFEVWRVLGFGISLD